MRTSSPQSDDLTLVGNKQSAARRIDGLIVIVEQNDIALLLARCAAPSCRR